MSGYEALLSTADGALYAAKSLGKNRSYIAPNDPAFTSAPLRWRVKPPRSILPATRLKKPVLRSTSALKPAIPFDYPARPGGEGTTCLLV